ncbi:unnamed protein product [Chrysoparadoxa australica]
MGRLFLRYLESQNLYSCCECGAHLSSNSQIISKNFQGKWGKAYLFDTVVNPWKEMAGLVNDLCNLYFGGLCDDDCTARPDLPLLPPCAPSSSSQGPFVKRTLTTGLHTVADIYCQGCQTLVGWKYENAYEESQKYKEGKKLSI